MTSTSLTRKRAKKIGSKGGQSTVQKYGREHMVRLIKRRWRRVKALRLQGSKTV